VQGILFQENLFKMEANSQPIKSNQSGVHPRLEGLVKKYLTTRDLQELHLPSVAAFESLESMAGDELKQRQLILDSGCGTGTSTRQIAAEHPDHIVFGIDRSESRLGKTGHSDFPAREGNIFWIRSQLETFWKLAKEREWELVKHYLLYPNPYPKASQLQRRWHANPVFPVLLGLGGQLELRCNWKTYAEEFATAIELVSGCKTEVQAISAIHPISAFEQKYSASGHTLYRVAVESGTMARVKALLARNHEFQLDKS
jgi:tRNA (guanine-N7-)-methyltransferase